jgi:hypothetical protein
MPENIFIPMTVSALCFGISVAAGVAGQKKLSDIFALSGLFFLIGAASWAFAETRRLPAYGRLETNLHISLVLALCVETAGRRPHISNICPWGRAVVCLLLLMALFTHEGLNPDFFMYEFISVQLFFFLRLTAGGVLIFAFLLFAIAWITQLLSSKNETPVKTRAATTALILGAVLFLGSEFSGTFWSSLSYGDTWHWSRNFFRSSAIFLILMLPLHAPVRLKKNIRGPGLGTLCTAAVIMEIVL